MIPERGVALRLIFTEYHTERIHKNERQTHLFIGSDGC